MKHYFPTIKEMMDAVETYLDMQYCTDIKVSYDEKKHNFVVDALSPSVSRDSDGEPYLDYYQDHLEIEFQEAYNTWVELDEFRNAQQKRQEELLKQCKEDYLPF